MAFVIGAVPAPAFAQIEQSATWSRPSQSLLGPTGYINLPSSETVDYENLSFGIHRFGLGVLFSWPRNLEYGVSFKLQEITTSSFEQTKQTFSPSAKLRLLNSPKWGRAAVGFRRKTYYAVYEQELVRPLNLEAGGSITNFAGVNTGTEFMALVYKTGLSRYMAELDGRTLQPAVGWRYMIASYMAMDLLWVNIRDFNNKFENFAFGLTLLWGKSS